MNKSEYVLAVIVSGVFVLWGLFGLYLFGLAIPRELRFTVLYFSFLIVTVIVSAVIFRDGEK